MEKVVENITKAVVNLIVENSGDEESINQKFNTLQKEAYEREDREALIELKKLVDDGSIKLSPEVIFNFQDSLHFLNIT